MRPDRRDLGLGASLLLLAAALAVLAPWIAPEPNRVDLGALLQPPSPRHWLGTDGLGRDVASRLVHGARVSLLVGLGSAAFALLVGVPLGATSGYFGGAWDAAISRGIEAVLCFPTLLLALALLSVSPPWLSGLPEPLRLTLALGITGWTPAARYLRAEFLRLRDAMSVQSARAAGAGHARVLLLHVLPQAAAPVLVTAAFGVGAAALAEATLSFIGVGISPPAASWGGMLREADRVVGQAWWLALFPGAALFAVVLACNRLAEGLRDRLDPRRRAA